MSPSPNPHARSAPARRALRVLSLLCLPVCLAFPACQGTGLSTGVGPVGSPDGPGTIQLSDQDLAPVDLFIDAGADASRTQWILGDRVEVTASKEYFAQNLAITVHPGHVRRTDRMVGEDTHVRLRYIGARGSESAQTNPRVLVGTGLTITAREEMIIRLVRTRDAQVPVRLQITATGDASYGHREEVRQEGPQLTLGGGLVRSQGRLVWQPWGNVRPR